MLLIYTPKITSRINYTFKLVFLELLGVDYQITTDVNNFLNYRNAKFSYAGQPVSDELFFWSSGLLLETGAKELVVGVSEFQGSKILFPSHRKASLPFDPFASVFYMVSRYEEYQPFMKDAYGRFDAQESIAEKNNFLHKPVVNCWVEMLKKIISDRFSDFNFPQKKFRFIPTIDIDNAYAYLHKGVVRCAGGLAKSIVQLDFREFAERIKVFFKIKNDPYDCYEFLLGIHREYNLDPVYFILFADYGEKDKNVPVQNRSFQNLIKSLADYAEVGTHPSFASVEKKSQLKIELDRLSAVVNKEIKSSRQHFLRLSMPGTYRRLMDLDILHDYTMGYATKPGFRAGICNSFQFYDLDLEEETKLRIHPFMLMDGTLRKYLKLKPEEAFQEIRPLIDEVKAVNGTFISLWHNESLGTSELWKGWRSVYEDMVKYATQQ